MKLYKENPPRWGARPEMAVTYEFEFRGVTVKPGMKFKMKNDRTIFTFTCLVTNMKTQDTWIEAMTSEGFRSIRPEKVYKLIGIKKSRLKKILV